jgi:hypothetical protein
MNQALFLSGLPSADKDSMGGDSATGAQWFRRAIKKENTPANAAYLRSECTIFGFAAAWHLLQRNGHQRMASLQVTMDLLREWAIFRVPNPMMGTDSAAGQEPWAFMLKARTSSEKVTEFEQQALSRSCGNMWEVGQSSPGLQCSHRRPSTDISKKCSVAPSMTGRRWRGRGGRWRSSFRAESGGV